MSLDEYSETEDYFSGDFITFWFLRASFGDVSHLSMEPKQSPGELNAAFKSALQSSAIFLEEEVMEKLEIECLSALLSFLLTKPFPFLRKGLWLPLWLLLSILSIEPSKLAIKSRGAGAPLSSKWSRI